VYCAAIVIVRARMEGPRLDGKLRSTSTLHFVEYKCLLYSATKCLNVYQENTPSQYLALMLRLKIILTVCMAAVSIVSVMLVRIVPAALFNIPIFFAYCAAIVVVRARMKLERI